MKLPTLQPAVIEALRSAGATEEMIASAVKASGESRTPHPGGRPRKHANEAERAREYRKRKRRHETSSVTADDGRDRDETGFVTPVTAPPCDETSSVTPDETDDVTLRRQLLHAGQGNVDLWADVEPIRALLDQGCDLEADILPIIAREVPELPRPLKKWGAPWLVRDILAAREQRLAGHRVEDPPPPRHTPAIEWDEFVGGYRAGLIKWNTARLGPKPGEPGCCAPAEVLREHGFRP